MNYEHNHIMTDFSRCLICGKNGSTKSCTGEKFNGNSEQWIFWKWNEECARTMCNILFGCEANSLYMCLKNSQFCNSCQQLVRDVNFAYKQLQSFQKTLSRLSNMVRKRVSSNYSKVKEKCGATENIKDIHEVADRCQIDPTISLDDYSHDEIVEIIYTVASKFRSKNGLISEETHEGADETCPTENESNFIAPIKQEAIKRETDDWDAEDTCSMDWGLDDEEYRPSKETRRKRIGAKKLGISPSTKNALFANAMKRKKSESWSSRFAKVQAKKNNKTGENIPKRGRPRKCFLEDVKPKGKRGRPRKYPLEDVKPPGKRGRPRKYSLEDLKPTGKRGRPRKPDSDEMKPKKTVRCSVEDCPEMFSTEEKMKIHIRAFHEGVEKPYECSHSHCSASFATRKEWMRHRKQVHDKRKKKDHFCKFCGKSYENETELLGHYSEAHLGPNPFICAFCPEVFSNSVHLRMHVKKVHPDPEDLMKPHCKICDKYFSNQNNYNMHMKSQHGNPELVPACPDCNRQFSSRGALKKHMTRYHSGEVKYTCETCGKSFSYLGDLNEHAKLHDESNKKYACKICDKKFASSETCKVHEVTHTDIKEFICQFCGNAFSRRGNLTAHIKLHTREGDAPLRIRKPKQQVQQNNAININKNSVLNFSMPYFQMEKPQMYS